MLLFIDLSKAFDMLKPKLLLVKLVNYGLSISVIRFLECYLSQDFNRSDLGKNCLTLLILI